MNLILLFHEVNLLSKWIPTVKESSTLVQKNIFRHVIYQRFDPPWPFAGREVIMEIAGWVLPEKQALVFSQDWIKDGLYDSTLIKRKQGLVDVIWTDSFGYIQPLSQNKTLFKLIV